MTEIQLTEEQLEALRKVGECMLEIMERVREIFKTMMNTLRDAVEKTMVRIRIAWRHCLLSIQPDSQVYEWWLLVAARRQLVLVE